jgi:hypothetical protein
VTRGEELPEVYWSTGMVVYWRVAVRGEKEEFRRREGWRR